MGKRRGLPFNNNGERRGRERKKGKRRENRRDHHTQTPGKDFLSTRVWKSLKDLVFLNLDILLYRRIARKCVVSKNCCQNT